ncbi:permease family protein [Streptococcus pyogenes]|nr:permease family protein [Streptococcus pyogenes]
MEKFFKLSENGTTVSTEIMAGLTTFFAMSYILFVNPSILGAAGMPSNAVFLATIIAAVISTLIMGLFANVPYALAPGMGLNVFFHLYSCFCFRVFMARSLGNGFHLWIIQYFYYRNQVS